METISIHTDYIKLDQLLKYAGMADSGAFAKNLILNENVKVNDNICIQRGKKIFPNDIVWVKELGTITVISES